MGRQPLVFLIAGGIPATAETRAYIDGATEPRTFVVRARSTGRSFTYSLPAGAVATFAWP
jgi:hypothetical protein